MNPTLMERLFSALFVHAAGLRVSGATAVAGPRGGFSVTLPHRYSSRSLRDRFMSRMSGFSRAAAAGTLNFLYGISESFAKPTEVYLALCTVVPTNSSTGETITEATGATGYARIKVTGSIATAVEGATSSITNNAELVGAAITAGSATVIGWATTNNKETGKGKVIAWGTCTSTVISTTQTPPTVATGKLITELA